MRTCPAAASAMAAAAASSRRASASSVLYSAHSWSVAQVAPDEIKFVSIHASKIFISRFIFPRDGAFW